MGKARVKFNLKSKFNAMLSDWAGRECTHIIVQQTIDDMGNIIDRSEDSTTIYGLIGNPGMSTSNQPIGVLQPGDLCAYFSVDYDIRAFDQISESVTRRDEICYENNTYKPELTNVMYDVSEKCINVFKLKRLSV